MIEIPGIVHGTEATGGAGPFEGHLIEIELAQKDRPSGFEARGDFGILGWDAIVEHATGGRGADGGSVDVVFERDGDAIQRPTAGTLSIAGPRLIEGNLFGDGEEAVQFGIEPVDARQAVFGQFLGGDGAAP